MNQEKEYGLPLTPEEEAILMAQISKYEETEGEDKAVKNYDDVEAGINVDENDIQINENKLISEWVKKINRLADLKKTTSITTRDFVGDSPLNENFEVMKKFQDQYGDEKGKDAYYATANKQERDPETFKMKESTDKERYERVVFLQGDEAEEPLSILDEKGPEAAINYLKQWHNYGEHEGSNELSNGSSDNIFKQDDGYILIWNTRLGYIGLEYDFEIGDAYSDTEGETEDSKYDGYVDGIGMDPEISEGPDSISDFNKYSIESASGDKVEKREFADDDTALYWSLTNEYINYYINNDGDIIKYNGKTGEREKIGELKDYDAPRENGYENALDHTDAVMESIKRMKMLNKYTLE